MNNIIYLGETGVPERPNVRKLEYMLYFNSADNIVDMLNDVCDRVNSMITNVNTRIGTRVFLPDFEKPIAIEYRNPENLNGNEILLRLDHIMQSNETVSLDCMRVEFTVWTYV